MGLTPKDHEARTEVLRIQNEQGVESYVAYELGSAVEWRNIGQPDHVTAKRDLEAAWSIAPARISYHHAHPDNRSLSPSDLNTLCRPGLLEIWAHCRSGISYRASLAPNISIAAFKTSHDRLNDNADPQQVQNFLDLCVCQDPLSKSTYDNLCHWAFCEALHRKQLISFEALDTKGASLTRPTDPNFEMLVMFAMAVISGNFPQPAITEGANE